MLAHQSVGFVAGRKNRPAQEYNIPGVELFHIRFS